MILRRTRDALLTDSLNQLRAGGKISNTSVGGVARSLVEIGVNRLSEFFDALEFNLTQARLSRAAGMFLDIIGESRGIRRGGALQASVAVADKSIRFYTADGAALATLIPTRLISRGIAVRNTAGTVTFAVSEDVTFDSVTDEVFVPAASTGSGAGQNVGKGLLTSHDLGNSQVLVTNDQPISNASAAENDDNYRFRLTRSIFLAASANREAIRTAAFGAADVSDVQIRPFSLGVGTFEVMLVPRGNRVSSATIRTSQALIDSVTALGSVGIVRAPRPLPVELTVEVVFTKETRDVDQQGIRDGVRRAILQYLADIPIGGTFVVNELTQRVHDVSTSIFDSRVLCFCFRSQPQLLQNVTAFEDELFVPRDDIPNPIKVL